MATENLLEKVVRFTTPTTCMMCGQENRLLCAACRPTALTVMAQECYLCGLQNAGGRTCADCLVTTPLYKLNIVTKYDDVGRELIRRFKFEGDTEAGRLCARYMAELLDPTGLDLVVAVTTTPARRRQRGYDQAEILAREVAAFYVLPYSRALIRIKPVHQIGQDRETRLAQAQGLYAATKPGLLKGNNILLIDDVVTTGATITSAAQAVHEIGAASVRGLAFARD